MTAALALSPLSNPLTVTSSTSVPPPSKASAKLSTGLQRIKPESPASGTRALRTRYVYGDSTPFPFDLNVIELLCDAIDCGVGLMRAEEEILAADACAETAAEMRIGERAWLIGLGDAVTRAVSGQPSCTSERVTTTAGSVLSASKSTIERELCAADDRCAHEVQRARSRCERAREDATAAFERFAVRHEMPDTETSLLLGCVGDTYEAEAVLRMPIGVEAHFALSIAPDSPWTHPRRVNELCKEGVSVHVPRMSGLVFKAVERTRVKLDKLYVRSVKADPDTCIVQLVKDVRNKEGHELRIERGTGRIVFRDRLADGSFSPDEFDLDADDRVAATAMFKRIVGSVTKLRKARVSMRSARFRGKPLTDQNPRALCEQIVAALAPVVSEIALRSGAPGELVLRREIPQDDAEPMSSARRRDELYVRKEFLWRKIDVLPIALRKVFAPLELGGVEERLPMLRGTVESLDDDDVELA